MPATFPTSPINGELANVNSITYVYAAAQQSWTRVPGSAGGGGSAITNGTTNVTTSTNGNANVTIAGTSNVVVWSTTGEYVTGLISATANITGGNLITAGQVVATGNVTGGNLIQGGTRVIKWTTVANTAPTNAVPGDFWYDSYASKKYQYTDDGTSNTWVDQSSPTTFTTLTTNQILNGGTSGTGNIGASGATFNTVFAKATSAQYADLAEKYESDNDYLPGTVVIFGGEKEITASTQSHDTRVAGVISTDPAFIMNSESTGLPVALTGRVPCFVKGPVNKGDLIVTSDIGGTGQRLANDWKPGCVLGKSLENITDDSVQTIEVVVGRF